MEFREIYKNQERRVGKRLEEIIPIEYVFIDDVEEVSLSKRRSGIIRNISASGCCLEVERLNKELKEDFLMGKLKLVLEFNLPIEKKPIRAIAKLIWLSKVWKNEGKNENHLMGLQFIDITASVQDAIKDYIIKSYFVGE